MMPDIQTDQLNSLEESAAQQKSELESSLATTQESLDASAADLSRTTVKLEQVFEADMLSLA